MSTPFVIIVHPFLYLTIGRNKIPPTHSTNSTNIQSYNNNGDEVYDGDEVHDYGDKNQNNVDVCWWFAMKKSSMAMWRIIMIMIKYMVKWLMDEKEKEGLKKSFSESSLHYHFALYSLIHRIDYETCALPSRSFTCFNLSSPGISLLSITKQNAEHPALFILWIIMNNTNNHTAHNINVKVKILLTIIKSKSGYVFILS